MPQRPKIMIADDDLSILDATALLLEDAGFEVITCCRGDAILDTEIPDLYLVDAWMSGVNGVRLVKRLKADRRRCQVPVIMFSANLRLDQLAAEAGADGYVAKPYDADQLVAAIEAQLHPTTVKAAGH